jgi:hypothetical protein
VISIKKSNDMPEYTHGEATIMSGPAQHIKPDGLIHKKSGAFVPPLPYCP